ncbi:MAG: hypothetical protein SOW66_04625 [Porphyromonas sp.]|nr:hypothetical protein [Porphyromonas sp.]
MAKKQYLSPKVLGPYQMRPINIMTTLSSETILDDWEDGGDL